MTALLVGIFAGIGAILRYFGGEVMKKHLKWHLPWLTFAVNMLAAFLIGFFFAENLAASTYKIAAVGFCGGVSTQSTFNFELFAQLKQRQYGRFAIYFLMSYGLGFGLCLLGACLAKWFPIYGL